MNKLTFVTTVSLSFFLFLQIPWLLGPFGSNNLSAQSVKKTTLSQDGSTINVKIIAPADVVKVKPYIKAKKGKEEGNLYLDVVIKNTATEPQAYSVFGQGKTDTGGWLGGMNKVPKKGKLDPGKEVTTKVKTRYEGKSVPKEIRLEVFPRQ